MSAAANVSPSNGTADVTGNPDGGVSADVVAKIRAQFPALHQNINGKPLVYLDSAASTHKPQAIIDAMVVGYSADYSNVHRGIHTLSQRATEAYEAARHKVAAFLGTTDEREIIFTRGTTESINLVASAWGGDNLGPGDEVLITGMEHHSNIVPWQMACARSGATLRHVPLLDDGSISIDDYQALLSPRTKMVSVVHISNALGTINPVAEMIERAHAVGAKVLIDGAQAVQHVAVDVRALDADFYAFSGHKLYGPTGIGVLYGKHALLDAMSPYQGGGDMIRTVTLTESTWASLPNKFEAGTPAIVQGIGLGAAVDWVQGVGLDVIAAHEEALLAYGTAQLEAIEGLRLIGTAAKKSSVLSFVTDNAHPSDLGTILDLEGIAVRVGHHCAQPVMTRLGVPATCRASLGVYNTREDIDRLVAGLHKCMAMFA